jgi:membrane protease subunit HflK
MNGHEHHPHDHSHDAPETRDAGSQALAEALGSSFTIVKIVMGLMVVLFIVKCFFQVGPQEKAIILRFGKPVGAGDRALLGAGLHWSFPYPIDEVVRIPIAQIQTVKSDNGWFFVTPEQDLNGDFGQGGADLNPMIDSYTLTSDTNIIHVRATLSYHVTDPIRYVFNFMDASNAVQNALDNALLYASAKFTADDALINSRAQFLDAVQARVSDLLEQENLGVEVNNCAVDSMPPRQLMDIFNQVQIARQTRLAALQDARSYENQTTNNAMATAASIINEAESAKARYVDSLNGEAKRFNDILPKYKVDPDLYVQQTFLRAIGPVLTNVQDKWFLPVQPGDRPYQLRLQLNRPLPGTNAMSGE